MSIIFVIEMYQNNVYLRPTNSLVFINPSIIHNFQFSDKIIAYVTDSSITFGITVVKRFHTVYS